VAGKSSEAGKKLIGFWIKEEIGIGVYNPMAIPCPEGCIRVWDEIEAED